MIIVLVLVLVLFGGSQLPKLAKNLGKAQKEFKDGIGEANKSSDEAAPAVPPAQAAPATPPVQAAPATPAAEAPAESAGNGDDVS